MGVSGWMFLLVPAYRGCPGQTAVKWLLLLYVSIWAHIKTAYRIVSCESDVAMVSTLPPGIPTPSLGLTSDQLADVFVLRVSTSVSVQMAWCTSEWLHTTNYNLEQHPFNWWIVPSTDITATTYVQSRNVVSLQNFCKVEIRLPAGTDRFARAWRL